MKLQDLETLLLIHGLHRCKLTWAADHWIATVRDSADMTFTGRADHIENAVRLAVEAFLDSYRPVAYRVAVAAGGSEWEEQKS